MPVDTRVLRLIRGATGWVAHSGWLAGWRGVTNFDGDFLKRLGSASSEGAQTNFCGASRRQHDELVYAHWPEQANIELVFAAKSVAG